MRILHVNKFLYRRGGAEAYMWDVAALQREAGHEVEFFAMRHPENEPARFERWFPTQVDFEPAPDTLPERVRGAGRLLWSRSAAAGIESTIRAFRPDLVHLHNIYHQLSPSILGPIRRARIPSVMTLHDYKLACPTYRFLDHGNICEACVPRRFWNAALRRCNGGSFAASALNAVEMTWHTAARSYGAIDLFACPSRFLEAKMRESRVFPSRLRWVPNFVDVGSIVPKDRPGGDVLYAGRLSHEKGVDILLEAIAQRPALSADVAGDGSERGRLEALATSLGVADRVRFHGRLAATELRALMRGSAVLAVPSRWYENMPLIVLEALASGVPVVATDLGGVPELIDPGVDGLVVAREDPVALGAALSGIVEDPGRGFAMGRSGRQKAEREFAPRPHLDRLATIYEEAATLASVDPGA